VWNKIGATLANFGNCLAAVTAYERALRLRPNYPRAWSNLGIAHLNLKEHAEAARLYLSALSLNPKATHLWNYIRTACQYLGREDLLPFIDSHDIAHVKNAFPGSITQEDLPLAEPIAHDEDEAAIEHILRTMQL